MAIVTATHRGAALGGPDGTSLQTPRFPLTLLPSQPSPKTRHAGGVFTDAKNRPFVELRGEKKQVAWTLWSRGSSLLDPTRCFYFEFDSLR